MTSFDVYDLLSLTFLRNLLKFKFDRNILKLKRNISKLERNISKPKRNISKVNRFELFKKLHGNGSK